MISHAWVENAKNFFEDVLKSMFRNEASAEMKSKDVTHVDVTLTQWGTLLQWILVNYEVS